jgi:magnesium transporter
MATLSRLRDFKLIDGRQRHAQLLDLVVGLLDHEHPPVTSILYRKEGKEDRLMSWRNVSEIDWHERVIRVTDLDEGSKATAELLQKEVLLARDILDALVLDLEARRATRANDLWLEERDGELSLTAVDTSSGAILRRVTRGLFGDANRDGLSDWKYVEFLRGDPQAVRSGAGYNLRIARLPAGEIAVLCSYLPYLHAAELLTLLPDDLASDTLEAMPPERQLQVLEELEDEQAQNLLALMAPDLATDLIGRLMPRAAKRFIEGLPEVQRDRVIELLRYPESVVGGIMTNDVVFVKKDITVSEARLTLRERLKEPDFVSLIYIVEDEERKKLCGVISLRQLLVTEDDDKIEDIMDPYVVTLAANEDATAASYRLVNSHLAAMPVIGNDGQLLGAVTIDAAVSKIAPPSWSAQAPRVFS